MNGKTFRKQFVLNKNHKKIVIQVVSRSMIKKLYFNKETTIITLHHNTYVYRNLFNRFYKLKLM